MRILFSGDVAWDSGRKVLQALLTPLKQSYGPFDFVIVNCENAAHGKGMTEKIYNDFTLWGVDAMTSGNHIWDKSAFFQTLNEKNNVFRPANYHHSTCPGRGAGIIERNGKKLGIINLQGQVYMPPINSPFTCADQKIEELKSQCNENLAIIVDFHAEATSEKQAMGYYLDGRVSAVLGTHTHVQTADEQILPKGTAFISDVGMTGGQGGILGVKLENAIPKFLNGMPSKFEACDINPAFNGVVIEINDLTGLATRITRLNIGV